MYRDHGVASFVSRNSFLCFRAHSGLFSLSYMPGPTSSAGMGPRWNPDFNFGEQPGQGGTLLCQMSAIDTEF